MMALHHNIFFYNINIFLYTTQIHLQDIYY